MIKTGKIVPNDRLGVSKFHNVRETSLDDGWVNDGELAAVALEQKRNERKIVLCKSL